MGVEQLGTVTVPSGVLMVVDTGLLNLWSHDRVPTMPEGVLSDEAATALANAAVDFRIEGQDAEAAGRAFNRQSNPLYLFDIPGRGVAAVTRDFEALVRVKGLRASLVPQASRISHRQRVSLALDAGQGAGMVQFHGIPAVAIGDLPRDSELTVVGARMMDGPFPDLWRWVALDVRPGMEVHRSVEVGAVAVDWARLMFIDADALGSWRHEEPVDGKADFVFWGRDAEELATKVDAVRLSDTEFGWTDLDIDLAAERGMRVERMKAKKGLKVAVDFRPHSDHFQLLAKMRSTSTESGTLKVGNSLCCGFFTSWGDGFFPVRLGLDDKGAVVRVQIELGTEDAIRNMKAVNGLPLDS